MKKTFTLILLLGLFVSIFGVTDYYDTAWNLWANKLLVADTGLSSSMSTISIADGGTNTPLSISTAGLMLGTSTRMYFRDTATSIYSSDSNKLSIISGSDLTVTVPTGSKFYLGTTSNYITANSLTLGSDVTCVNVTGTGTVTVPTVACTTGTVSGTLTVDGASTLTGAITATGGVTGDLTGDVSSTGTSSFEDITMTGTISATRGSGTGIAITSNGTIGGTLAVTGVTTATGGVVGDLTGDVTGNVTGTKFSDRSTSGVTVDSLQVINGSIRLNGGSHYVAFDTDDDTYLYSDTDDIVDFKIGNSDDFTFSANLFTAIFESVIKSNTISETTSETGVTLDGCLMEGKTNVYNLFAPTGTYVAFTATDIAESADPAGHSLADPDDVYIGGILEVDGAVYLDGTLNVYGATELESLTISGTSPQFNPTTLNQATGTDFIIHGGDANSTGGDLFLDGGAATTDGDVILGDRDGNVSINSPLLFPEYSELPCDGGEISAVITETINYINATANDTINVADGVEGQTISFVTWVNDSTYDIHIVPASCGWGTETILDSKTSACELIFHKTSWYIKSITD